MKIIKNNVCYVNFKDLIGFKTLDDLHFDKSDYKDNDYIKLTEEKDIEYVKKRDDILDYFSISSLTYEELDAKIKELERKLEPYYLKLKMLSPPEKIVLFNKAKFKNKFFKLDKLYYDLINYRNNKRTEDDRIASLLNENVLTKAKRP